MGMEQHRETRLDMAKITDVIYGNSSDDRNKYSAFLSKKDMEKASGEGQKMKTSGYSFGTPVPVRSKSR